MSTKILKIDNDLSRQETLQDLLQLVNQQNYQPMINFEADIGREVID